MKAFWILPLGLALAVPAAIAQQTNMPNPPNAAAPQGPDGGGQHHMDRHMSDGSEQDGPQKDHFMMMVRHDGPGGMEGHEGMEGHGGMEMEHHSMMHGDWWKNPELVTRIGLTPEQVKKLDTMSLEGQVQMIHLHAALEEQELMLRSSMEGPAIDQHKADLEIDKVADARAALEKADAKLKLGLRTVLTPDQWTKMHTPPEHHMSHSSDWKRPAPSNPGQGPA